MSAKEELLQIAARIDDLVAGLEKSAEENSQDPDELSSIGRVGSTSPAAKTNPLMDFLFNT